MAGSIGGFKRAFGRAESGLKGNSLPMRCRVAGAAWPGTSRAIRDQLSRLRTALAEEFRDGGLADTVTIRFDSKTSELAGTLDGRLADALEGLAEARDESAQAKLRAEVSRLVARCRAQLQDQTLADLDENPFVPLSIRSTLDAMLSHVPAELA